MVGWKVRCWRDVRGQTTGVSQHWFSGHFRQVFFNTNALPRINIGANVWGESSMMTRDIITRYLLQALASQQVPRAIIRRPAEWAAGSNSLPAACNSLFIGVWGVSQPPEAHWQKKNRSGFPRPP